MSEDRDDRIRRRAHELWEQDGRPDGHDVEHWASAEQDIAREEAEAAAPPAVERPPEGTPPLSPAGGVAGPRQPRRTADPQP